MLLGIVIGQPLGGLHDIGPLQLAERLHLIIRFPLHRAFRPQQQQHRVSVHVLFLDKVLGKGRQDGELGLHRLLAQPIWQGPPEILFAEKRSPMGIRQALPPLFVEHELRHIAIGNQLLWWGLAVVQIAHHDAASQIFGADGGLAKAPVEKGGQLAAVGLVVVFVMALLQQPVDRQFVDQPGVGDIVQTEVG